MLNDISAEQIDDLPIWLCIVSDLSKDLKTRIREELSSICFGFSSAASKDPAYTYKETLKEFIRRYKSKPSKTQKGMIGELLAHILITEYEDDLQTVSPYFNLEERSIKKGFDIVFHNRSSKDLWYAEVKSGEYKKSASGIANAHLLARARKDMKKKLASSDPACWHNAINGAIVVCEQNQELKERVKAALKIERRASLAGTSTSVSKNAVLVSVLYKKADNPIPREKVKDFHDDITARGEFAGVLVFSIQKGTYKKIYQFLKDEVK